MDFEINSKREIHLVVEANIYVLESSLLKLKEIIQVTNLKSLSKTMRELGELKKSIESLEEQVLVRKNREK